VKEGCRRKGGVATRIPYSAQHRKYAGNGEETIELFRNQKQKAVIYNKTVSSTIHYLYLKMHSTAVASVSIAESFYESPCTGLTLGISDLSFPDKVWHTRFRHTNPMKYIHNRTNKPEKRKHFSDKTCICINLQTNVLNKF
jgi:hypothetical protein